MGMWRIANKHVLKCLPRWTNISVARLAWKSGWSSPWRTSRRRCGQCKPRHWTFAIWKRLEQTNSSHIWAGRLLTDIQRSSSLCMSSCSKCSLSQMLKREVLSPELNSTFSSKMLQQRLVLWDWLHRLLRHTQLRRQRWQHDRQNLMPWMLTGLALLPLTSFLNWALQHIAQKVQDAQGGVRFTAPAAPQPVQYVQPAPVQYASAPVSYAAPVQYAAAPVTYAAPATYAAAPVTYAAAPVTYAAPTYAAAPTYYTAPQ